MRPLYYILDEQKQPRPATIEEYIAWCGGSEDEAHARKRVAFTEFPDGTYVSTVFLAIDHNYAGNGSPILWETMVFGGPLDQMQDRYASHEAAVAGHQAMIQRVELAAQPHGEAALDLGGWDALEAIADAEGDDKHGR